MSSAGVSGNSGTMSKEEREERDHFLKVYSAFKAYKRDSMERLSRASANLKRLPVAHQQILEKHGYAENLKRLEKCVQTNYGVLAEIAADSESIFENADHDVGVGGGTRPGGSCNDDGDGASLPQTAPMDVEKVQSTIRQFVRDWSKDGSQERSQCYQPLLDELSRIFRGRRPAHEVKVLVPGAGLGRLAYEVAKLGFDSQGNEFSLFMLLASNFVLNKCQTPGSRTLHPWIHQSSNNASCQDQTRPVSFPDVNPSRDLPRESRLSMIAGDFLEVYSAPEYASSKDAVVTCFFLDCAHNVLDFIQLIHRILKPGGHWLNLGPLLYHFADVAKESSVEPSYSVVRELVKECGFDFVKEQLGHKATYCHNDKSMMKYEYNCVVFTCVKAAVN